MRKEQYSELLEKYETLKNEFEFLLVKDSIGSSIESHIKGMPVDFKGNPSLSKSNIFDGLEICILNKPSGHLSGCYNDCVDLGNGKTAIIQCEASGRGVSASLISIIVVTLFESYCVRFRKWKPETLIALAKEINTIVESMGFKGRFVVFQLGIIDSVKKEYISTNAGLNIIYYMRNKQKGFKKLEFPESPAAGVFPTEIVNLNSGFKLSRIKLKNGDVLLFPGDGFEESQRYSEENEMEEFGIDRLLKHSNAIIRKEKIDVDWIRVNSGNQTLLDYSKDSGKLEDSLGSLLATDFLYRLKNNSNMEDKKKSARKIEVNSELADSLFRITPEGFLDGIIEKSEDVYGNKIFVIEEDKIESQFMDLSFMALRIDDNLLKIIDPEKEEKYDVLDEIEVEFDELEEFSHELEEAEELEEI